MPVTNTCRSRDSVDWASSSRTIRSIVSGSTGFSTSASTPAAVAQASCPMAAVIITIGSRGLRSATRVRSPQPSRPSRLVSRTANPIDWDRSRAKTSALPAASSVGTPRSLRKPASLRPDPGSASASRTAFVFMASWFGGWWALPGDAAAVRRSTAVGASWRSCRANARFGHGFTACSRLGFRSESC